MGLSLAFLAACDGSDGTLGNPAFQFGQAFATAFNLGPNAAPAEDLTIAYMGAPGVSLTADPIDF